MSAIIQASSSYTGQPLWILQTEHTAYAFGLDASGYLQHVYWGTKLVVANDYESPDALPMRRAFERPGAVTREEFAVWGDYNFCEPCLKATYGDGVREVLLEYESSTIEEQDGLEQLVIVMQDPYYPLRVRLFYRPIPQYDLIERHVSVENTGEAPITLERIMTATWHFPDRPNYRLRTLNGKWGGEFQIQEADIPLGKQVIDRRRGASGFDSNPWFAIAADGANEVGGEVWFGALAFSGNWQMTVERTAFGQLMLTGGINDFDFAWHLEGGEQFETPLFVGGYTESGFGEVSRLLHGYQINHVLPQVTLQQPRPVVYNSWYVTTFDVSYANQTRAAEIAAELGVELFIMDDGWFGQRKTDRAGLGDWYVDPDKFPDGLGPLIAHVKELGMDFGIWVEPEMVNPDSDLYRAHPDWVYHFPNRPRTELRHQLVLNFARSDVQEFAFGFLDELLSENDIPYFKWDMNRHFSEPGWPDAPPGRDREIWVRHARGVYDVLRRLRAKHPAVMIESCSGGGGRVDLGIMEHVEHFWESDNTDPYDDLFMFEGFSQVFAPLTRLRLVTDPISINNDRALSLEYCFHVAMMGMLGIGSDITKWSDDELDEARRLVALYKDLRETVQFGSLHRLRSPRTGDLAVTQFVHRDQHESVVFAYLHSSRFGPYRSTLRLEGLDPQAMYRIDADETPVSGQALMKRGLFLELTGDFVSRLIVLRRV